MHAERYLQGCRSGFADLISGALDWSFDQATEFYRTVVPKLNRHELALLGANDRFFLLTTILNRTDAVHPWIYERVREVEKEPDGCLDLWSRYHYKSTIITFAGSIEEIIRNPEVKIGIFAATNKLARPFLKQLMNEMETNERLKFLYSDVFWANPRKKGNAPYWSMQSGIVVRRKGNPREPTVGAYGLIDGMPTGFHFDILDYDDLVTIELVTNEEMVRKTTVRFELSDNLGVGAGTRKRAAGTRYSFADTYGEIIEAGTLKVRIHAATDTGTLDGNPVFMSKEEWERVKRDQRSVVAAQMLQNPLAGKENTFQPSTLRPYYMRPRTLNVYIMGDPSMGKKKSTTGRSSDRTAITVVGIDAGGNKYLLDGVCHRMKLSERWTALRDLYNKWEKAEGVQFIKVGWERYGMQADLEYFKEQQQKKDQPQFEIIELSWTREGDQSKKARVQRLEPDFTNNKFYLPAKVWRGNIAWVAIDKDTGERQEKSGSRVCMWGIEEESGSVFYRPLAYERLVVDKASGQPIADQRRFAGVSEIIETNIPAMTRQEKEAERDGEQYRIIQPIKAFDEDRKVYDLTTIFFNEFLRFPFSPHDDLLDATSRVYDMEPVTPEIIEKELLDVPVYAN